MERRALGSLQVPVVGLGCNNFGMRIDEAATKEVVDAALAAGIDFFDTADSYGPSEEWLGRALAGRRHEAIIATKFGSRIDGELAGGAKPDYVRSACERSLRRLGVETIDLYQLHFPDPDTPIADTLGALDELVKAGKVREIGCSNFTAEMLAEADEAAGDGARFVSVQNQLSILDRRDEKTLGEVERLGQGYLPYFPLASGVLSGKYRRGADIPPDTRIAAFGPDRMGGLLNDRNFDVLEKLIGWAEDHGHTVLELAFAWLAARHPVASVIAGATRPEQVKANAAAGEWVLTPAEVAEVEALAPLPSKRS